MLSLAVAPRVVWAGAEALAPDHWAHAELDHFERRGFVRLAGIRPWSRTQVESWVETLLAVDPERYSTVEHQRLARLEEEFGSAASDPRNRFDRPIASLEESGWRGLADVGLDAAGLATRGGADPETGWGLASFDVTIFYGENFAYDTRVRAHLAEERGVRVDENQVSLRERNWNGLTSDFDRGVLAFERGPVRATFGREYLSWGARPEEALLVSDAGLSHDGLQFRLRLGRFTLGSAASLLGGGTDRQFAAHRLEMRLGSVRLGVQEAVVYASPRPELAYLFPVGFYYGNQFNERGDDNVLFGGDVRWVSPWAALEGELVVDDFIYDRDPAPQKWGGRLGVERALAVGGTDVDLQLEYVRMARWTFTHRQPSGVYAAGAGDPASGDPWLGHPLGPDADRWRFGLAWSPSADGTIWVRGERTRRGEGNTDLSGWVTGDPYDLGFPSGAIRTSYRAELGGARRVGRRLELRGAAALLRGEPGSAELRAEIRIDP
jgi:hypothetical protein